jgi:hypothetical protein
LARAATPSALSIPALKDRAFRAKQVTWRAFGAYTEQDISFIREGTMLQIFRIEHETTRIGPYQTRDKFTQNLAKQAEADQGLKSPGDDGLPLGDLPFSFVFGCTDVPTLKRWFFFGDAVENERIVKMLKLKGFRLVEFLVEDADCEVSTSGRQVAFYAGFSRDEGLVQVHDLNVLLAETQAGI